jgi:glucosylceramidase
MRMALSRRDFLRLSAAGAIAARFPKAIADSRAISMWSTAGNLRHGKLPSVSWSPSATRPSNAIAIEAGEEYQSILGFGPAFTDSACINLQRLDAPIRKKLFTQLFHPTEMNLSVGRTCIGSSDYAAKVYSFDDGLDPDPELKRFSIEHDRQAILPILREARSVNPDLWLLASPWSPPPWMKLNNSMLGGTMGRKWLASYAKYFEKFLAGYAAERVPINSVTVQNEVDTDQDGRMPACAWPQEIEISFVRDHLGPLLAKSAHRADIWVLDHNYDLWGRALDELADDEARKYIKGIAWHGYVGDAGAMTRVKQAQPQVDAFWTEGGPDWDTPGYETEWAKWGASFTNILRNWSRCVITWNLALDEKGKPNVGPFNCAGLVTVHSSTRAVTYSGQFHALRHFSQHIRRGAKVVRSTGEVEGVHHVVVRNPDRTFAAVLTNTAKDKRLVHLVTAGESAGVELAPDSMTTLTWS